MGCSVVGFFLEIELLNSLVGAKMDRAGPFAGDNPFAIFNTWMAKASETEVNDPNAMTCATVDANGMPNARIVLLKEVEANAFVFYTNYESKKAQELEEAEKVALLFHWKSLGRQVRIRGTVTREDGPQADAYYASRPLQSRIGAWASDQSRPIASRSELAAKVEKFGAELGDNPKRPAYWGGYRVQPLEIEFWSNGEFRLHDRFRWTRDTSDSPWVTERLSP